MNDVEDDDDEEAKNLHIENDHSVLLLTSCHTQNRFSITTSGKYSSSDSFHFRNIFFSMICEI